MYLHLLSGSAAISPSKTAAIGQRLVGLYSETETSLETEHTEGCSGLASETRILGNTQSLFTSGDSPFVIVHVH